MISTPQCENVTVEVLPEVTHKASGEAIERGCLTTEVFYDWMLDASGVAAELAAAGKAIPYRSKPPVPASSPSR